MANMLSRARFRDEVSKLEEEEVSENYFASECVCWACVICDSREKEQEGETLQVGRILQGGEKDPNFGGDIRKTFFLEDVLLWEESKKLGGSRNYGEKRRILTKFHESNWAGHQGTWGTFVKIKQKYQSKGIYPYAEIHAKLQKMPNVFKNTAQRRSPSDLLPDNQP